MKNYCFFNYKIMGKLSNSLAAAALATSLTISPTNADTTKSPEVKTEVSNVKAKTRQQLEMMAMENEINSIQAQIKELEAKGLENLTDKEFERYAELTDKLIALEKQETAKEKQETAKEKQETAKEKQETAKEKAKTSADLREIKEQLSSIKGALLRE